jgi:hypothetical protein
VSTKVVLEMSLEEAGVVLLSLVDAQKGYTDGPAIPERIFNLREVITNLDAAMEDAVSNK